MKISLLCLLAGAVAVAEAFYLGLSTARRKSKIVGGSEVVPHSVPYQVGLFLKFNSFCGGSLLTRRYVLTAGHCGLDDEHPVVVLGAHRIQEDEPEQVRMVAKRFVTHEQFNQPKLSNDIAVIELPEDAPLNGYIQVVSLVPNDIGSVVGKMARVSGWGFTYDTPNKLSPVLQQVESTLIDRDRCAKEFMFDIPENVLCLDGSSIRSSCFGDSGGPLMLKMNGKTVQIGIVSFGTIAGCDQGYPSAFTRVASYLDWIRNNTDYKG